MHERGTARLEVFGKAGHAMFDMRGRPRKRAQAAGYVNVTTASGYELSRRIRTTSAAMINENVKLCITRDGVALQGIQQRAWYKS